MLTGFDPTIVVPLAGLLIGAVLGFVARRMHFCTLSYFERFWYADDSTGLRTWALAAVSAIAFSQFFDQMGYANLAGSFYLSDNLPITGSIIGGVAFGFGMALVGTCGFGALLRLGGGSLKAFAALLVLGLSALAAQRGLIAQLRVHIVDNLALDLGDIRNQSLGAVLSAFAGMDMAIPAAVIAVGGGLYWIFSSPAMRKNKSGIGAGILIGFLISLGWVVTTWGLSNAFTPIQIEAGSFVVPLGDTLLQYATFTGILPDYGVGLVIGVIIGAAIAASLARDVRWEACDDARELGRHIAGAFLMGVGGVFAFGCTIGQGVTGASTLALSVPITMISIAFGARMGLAWLLEGSIAHIFQRTAR